MDSNNTNAKTIKTIVPIKGNLLAKIKNKLKNNGSTCPHSESNDVINNNSQNSEVIPVNIERQQPPKVIIQKVEKVHIKIENLLNDHSSKQPSTSASLQNENVHVDVPEKLISSVEKESTESFKLDLELSDNDSNKQDTPKMVRTARKTKITPNIVRRRPKNASVHGDISATTQKVDLSEEISKESNINNNKQTNEQMSTQESVKNDNLETQAINNTINIKIEEIKLKGGNDDSTKNEEIFQQKIAPNEESKKNEENEDLMDTTEATWLNNISVMIGENRIREIDKGLKKIPAIVTGNKIQTENVELKLIINHLLAKLKADTVTETLDPPSMSGFNLNDSSKSEFSDTCDSMTEDDLSKDSTFFNESIENQRTSVKIQKTQDENNETNFDQPQDNIMLDENIKSENKIRPTTRKRRGQSTPSKILEKKMKKALSVQESCESDGIHLVQSPSRESSVDSITPPIRQSRRSNRIKDSSRESSIEKSLTSTKSVILDNDNKTKNLQGSSVKKSGAEKDSVKNKKVTRVQELRDREIKPNANRGSESSSLGCESDGLKINRGRKKKQVSLENMDAKKIPSVVAPIKKSLRIIQKVATTVNEHGEVLQKRKYTKRKDARKNISSHSDSECDTFNSSSELKSHSSLNDFNSKKYRSSIIERNDYLNKSSSVDKSKNEIIGHPVLAALEERLEKIKESDPSFISQQPQKNQKRPYLKTSAFSKGNFDISNTTESSADSYTQEETSVSHDSPKNFENGNIKNIMKGLIDKRKIEIPSSNTTQARLNTSHDSHTKESNKINQSNRGRSKTQIIPYGKITLKIFKQEKLQPPNENRVLYNEIMEAIRISDPSNIRSKKIVDESKKHKIELELKSLENFRCGNCGNLVTKHLWKEHLIAHGGIAWIDKFEFSINIDEWNEAIRRLINIMKIYQLEQLRCPNCNEDKRSALGHLSHVYVCAQDEETIERRKVKCQYCNERVLPYNMGAHRNKCKGLEHTIEDSKIENESDEDENDADSSKNSSIKSGERSKRKAVKKAEKKLKIIVNKLKNDSEGEENDISGLSSSNASIQEESSETEGSSGVESSNIETADEDEIEDDSLKISHRKGKPSVADTEEIKSARKLIAPYIESLDGQNIILKTIQWTREFIRDNLNENLLTKLAPKYKILEIKLASFLQQLQLRSLSMKFYTEITDKYVIDYQNSKINSEKWKELEVGNQFGSKESLTLFCGGSVSGLDWAQTKNGENFLVVSCNNSDAAQSNMRLEQTYKSCIQVYKLQNLVNEKCSTYENISTLLYMFSIVDGPIWSIKLHPFVIASDDRIGLLAVTTANQNVYIFSLPHLNENDNEGQRNLVISLEPSIICKLSEMTILNQEKYLLQVSTVNWYYRKDQINLLAAGYVNGYVSIWKIEDDEVENNSSNQALSLLPYLIFQPHCETITSIDFKSFEDLELLMLTSSMDRDMKVHVIENDQYRELSCQYGASRNSCAEWCFNWPGYLYGNDNCFAFSGLNYRQPVDFAARNIPLIQSLSSVLDLSMNHWLNFAVFVCDSGDVMGSNPSQLLYSYPKDRWHTFRNTILTYTDVAKLESDGAYGLIFIDLKLKKLSKRPKTFRIAPTELSQILQINAVRFNPNEKSHHFYAIGYETGFVRIKHLKNFK